MKNAKLILLTIVSVLLLTSCGGESEEKNSSTSATVATSPSTQPTEKSPAAIEPTLLKEYQESQKKLVDLLGKRVVKDNNQKVDPKIRGDLSNELVTFKQNIDNIKTTTTSNKIIQDKINNFSQIISFKDLSDRDGDLKNLQQRLVDSGKNLDKEKGKFFGEKTSLALTGKIKEFGQDLQALATSDRTASGSNLTPAKKPENPPADFNWLGAVASALSILSAIGSGIAIYLAVDMTKKTSKKNYQISTEIDRLTLENKTLKSNLKTIESERLTLSNRVDSLSQQQPKNYKTPASYSQEPKAADDYRQDLNFNQYASTSHSSSITNIPPVPPRQLAWIDEYNQDSRSFYKKYVKAEVLEEEQNIEGRRSGKVLTVNLSLAPQRNGGYWIFDRDNQLMLVPSSEVRINKFSRDTVEAMFDYGEFSSNYRKIRLLEPAIVEPNVAGGYQLVRRGRIEFE